MPTAIVSGEKLHYYAHTEATRASAALRWCSCTAPGARSCTGRASCAAWPATTCMRSTCPGMAGREAEGRSEIRAYAEVVRGFAESLGLRPFVLAGHSMGGAIALELAVQRFEQVGRFGAGGHGCTSAGAAADPRRAF